MIIEIPDGMTDDEFHDFYWSKTDEERIQIDRQLAYLMWKMGGLTDEEYAAREAKIDAHAKLIEDLKLVEEMKYKIERGKQLVEDRINARFADIMETESPQFFDEPKAKKSH